MSKKVHAEENKEKNAFSNDNPVPEIKIKEETNCQVKQEISTEANEEKIYTVENVLNRRKIGSKIHYLIKWRGYSSKSNTWEPSENVEQLDLVKFYEEARKNAQKEAHSGRKSIKR